MNAVLCCPSCHSDKYTSLPFGNLLDASESACNYRCLKCCSFFSTQAPVLRTPSVRAGQPEAAATALPRATLHGPGAQTRLPLSG